MEAIEATVAPETPPVTTVISSPTTTPGGATTNTLSDPTIARDVFVAFAVPTPIPSIPVPVSAPGESK